MNHRDKISSVILAHWQRHQPTMVAQFRQKNRLEKELEATAQQFSDRMYELTAVKKMDYRAAWEMAIHEFLLPEEEE